MIILPNCHILAGGGFFEASDGSFSADVLNNILNDSCGLKNVRIRGPSHSVLLDFSEFSPFSAVSLNKPVGLREALAASGIFIGF